MTAAAACATALFAGALVAVVLRGRARHTGGRLERTAAWLTEAGWRWGLGRYLGLLTACAAVAFGLAMELTSAPAVAVPPALLAAAVPRAVLARRRARRRTELRLAWPDGLRDLAASVSAGMSLAQAVDALSRSGPPPLRAAFARFPVLMPAIGTAAALERLRDDAADATTDRVVEVLVLAHERGGRMLPALLNDLAESAARDAHLQERIATAQLELRINARAVFALPWVVLCVLTARPGPFREFYASSRGFAVVAAGALLSAIGIALVERLGRPEIEPRLFARVPGPTP